MSLAYESNSQPLFERSGLQSRRGCYIRGRNVWDSHSSSLHLVLLTSSCCHQSSPAAFQLMKAPRKMCLWNQDLDVVLSHFRMMSSAELKSSMTPSHVDPKGFQMTSWFETTCYVFHGLALQQQIPLMQMLTIPSCFPLLWLPALLYRKESPRFDYHKSMAVLI